MQRFVFVFVVCFVVYLDSDCGFLNGKTKTGGSRSQNSPLSLGVLLHCLPPAKSNGLP
jgi:hypothetical protein